MHNEAMMDYAFGVTNNVDTEMDNENENNISGNALLSNGNTNGALLAASTYNPDFEVNNSSIDLETYSSGFTGLMRINRLVFLAEHCPPLRIEALKLALSYVMETFNTQYYSIIHKQLADAYNKL